MNTVELTILDDLANPVFLAHVVRIDDAGKFLGGTITDFSGKTLVPANSCYKISHVGFKTNEFCIGSQDTMIELEQNSVELAGVTITPQKAGKWGLWVLLGIAAIVLTYFALKK